MKISGDHVRVACEGPCGSEPFANYQAFNTHRRWTPACKGQPWQLEVPDQPDQEKPTAAGTPPLGDSKEDSPAAPPTAPPPVVNRNGDGAANHNGDGAARLVIVGSVTCVELRVLVPVNYLTAFDVFRNRLEYDGSDPGEWLTVLAGEMLRRAGLEVDLVRRLKEA